MDYKTLFDMDYYREENYPSFESWDESMLHEGSLGFLGLVEMTLGYLPENLQELEKALFATFEKESYEHID